MKNIGLESFFFAGKAEEEFLEEILKMMHIVLLNPQETKETLVKLKLGRAITNQFIVSNSFPICCRIVLKEKEKLA